MRTTVEFDPDVLREIERMRREEGRGTSEAVNELIRRGLTSAPVAVPYVPTTRSIGLRLDVSNVAEALDVLEGPGVR